VKLNEGEGKQEVECIHDKEAKLVGINQVLRNRENYPVVVVKSRNSELRPISCDFSFYSVTLDKLTSSSSFSSSIW
jgi:hypothetical protein